MALEDRICTSVDTALSELSGRIDQYVRAFVQQIVQIAAEVRADAVAAGRKAATDEVKAETRRQIEEVEREASMAVLARLLDSVRQIDAATSLSEVLDAPGIAAGRETSRAAVLVVRNGRLIGWKLSGFGVRDAQPKAVDIGLRDSGVLGLAVGAGHPATTATSNLWQGNRFRASARRPDGAGCSGDRRQACGRRRVRRRCDGGGCGAERLARIRRVAGAPRRSLSEALTAQKTAATAFPRFWVSGSAPSTQGPGPQASFASSPGASSGSDAPPGVNA